MLRVGDAVTFLNVSGWEGSSTDPADVQRLAGVATARLLDWRR